MKTKKWMIMITLVTLLVASTGITVFAATSINNCPIYTSASAKDKAKYTPYEIHQAKGQSLTNYQAWSTTDGGMYWFHETWICGLCGNRISKDTYMGSITDILEVEPEEKTE